MFGEMRFFDWFRRLLKVIVFNYLDRFDTSTVLVLKKLHYAFLWPSSSIIVHVPAFECVFCS